MGHRHFQDAAAARQRSVQSRRARPEQAEGGDESIDETIKAMRMAISIAVGIALDARAACGVADTRNSGEVQLLLRGIRRRADAVVDAWSSAAGLPNTKR